MWRSHAVRLAFLVLHLPRRRSKRRSASSRPNCLPLRCRNVVASVATFARTWEPRTAAHVLANVVTVLFAAALTSAAEPDFAFTLTNATQSASLRLRVELDGQPLAEVLRPCFEKLFSHLDRNSDQRLNADELQAAPSAGWLRRAAWGYLAGNHSEPLTLAETDTDHNGSVSLTELQAWYAKHGVGTMVAVAARSHMTPVLTAALWQTLDEDRDGRLSAEEFAAAPERLRKLDENDDDLVSAREIASSVEQPYPFTASARPCCLCHSPTLSRRVSIGPPS